MAEAAEADYSLSNPDTLTKYKTAAGISHKVLETVSSWLADGAKIVELCEKGDKLLDEEVAKVYKGKKVLKGIATPTTISPASHVTPFTPLHSDAEDAALTISAGELVKIQLGAQIDGFGAIVCDTVIVPKEAGKEAEITGRDADVMLATYYANELLLRLMVPPGLLASGTEEEKKKAASARAPTHSQISSLVEKVAKAYDVKVVQQTTSWQFERNEIEGKKKLILSPSDGTKGEGTPEVGDVFGVEIGMSLGSGKIKDLDKRATLLRKTATTYGLKRPSSRQTLSEIVKKFGNFPFSLRQLDDERAGKVGVVESVRAGVLREYKPSAESDGSAVTRLFTTIAITKNGITRLAAPPPLDLSKVKSDKKIEDEEILKILEQPLSKSTGAKKNKKKKKKAAKKEEEDSDDDSDE
ncbi:DNA-binding protein, 42 kDa [Cyphellophora europaea CBS 101466]|uniref:DNA-binding protein, 42 kDa n=1 Tax=Cyphellophora europaea (strain CBS 101466) TaxID=1220924 RepID=W2RT09_CYPE1|nr:DNA-binding protein, 42 kDa [Cyphellophora europaea CBS 101466]ETN39592.1 DNA-binding protein, 42 kDa [Cyphellophora europaea CBS 101466]